ncbi:hypothetical protein HK102_008183, partial [Quaeritorhiza haematococci]
MRRTLTITLALLSACLAGLLFSGSITAAPVWRMYKDPSKDEIANYLLAAQYMTGSMVSIYSVKDNVPGRIDGEVI